MPIVSDNKGGGDRSQLIAKRADGSIRQVKVISSDGSVLSEAFFPVGTRMDDPSWKSKMRFHWIDAFSDEELLDPANNLIFDKELIAKKREEALEVNKTKTLFIENIENYKRR